MNNKIDELCVDNVLNIDNKSVDESMSSYVSGYKQALIEIKDKIHSCRTKSDALNLIEVMLKSIGE